MVHCAISQSGISKLSFLEAGYAGNRHNFIRYLCMAVIPFIRLHHGYWRYWLWMDLASAHYANNMPVLLQQQSICFVPKDANPRVASLWSVEDCWAALKMAIYDGGWVATRVLRPQVWQADSISISTLPDIDQNRLDPTYPHVDPDSPRLDLLHMITIYKCISRLLL